MSAIIGLVEQSLRLLDFPNELAALDILHGEKALRLLFILVFSPHVTRPCGWRH